MTTSSIPIVGAPRLAAPAANRTVAVLSAGGLANFALIYFVQPLLPELASSFGIAAGSSGLALSSTTLAMMAGLFVAGPLSDRIGRSRSIAGSLIVSGLLTVAGAAMPTWELFLVTRVLSGFALAVLPAVALAYVRDSVGGEGHLKANATYIASTALGGAVGRLAPLPLSLVGGWQTAAIALGGLSVVAGIASAVALPADRAASSRLRIGDLLGGTLSSYRDVRILLVCAIGLAGMAVFVMMYNAVSFRLQTPPFSLGHAEALVYVAYIGGIVAPGVFQRAAQRFSRGATVLVGAGLIAASIGILAVANIVAVVSGLALLTFAFLGMHSLLSGWVVDLAHRSGRNTSRASSAYLLAFYLGSTLAGTASTHVWAGAGWTGVTIASGALVAATVALAVVALRIRRTA